MGSKSNRFETLLEHVPTDANTQGDYFSGILPEWQKRAKKKVLNPQSQKLWYAVKAPAIFKIRNVKKQNKKKLVPRNQGTKLTRDGLKGCVPEVSLADLQYDGVGFQKKVMEIRTREEQTNDWKGVANTLIVDSTEKDTEKACPPIHLLHDGFVGKVKMLKKPKTELGKLMGLHGEGSNSGKSIVDGTSVKVE
ncbi:40S ribosomal protein S3a-like [Rousettus aegyptiacus]|uniref:40S ribosomal protein S3a-like n=1 Tax=Rousettus aegyptiacus TaxID=9407 RepID=UPI00168CC2C0|nr:40S ribosomal protein S3a-like [Rousettus aegyptiacus]